MAGESASEPEEELVGRHYWELRQNLVGRRHGPLRSLATFAAGGKRALLNEVPTEEIYFSVLGTTVLITAAVAGTAAGLATGYLVYGTPKLSTLTIVSGLLWATIIFLLDRSLVKAPLNPWRLSPEVLGAIWEPASQTRWADVLSGRPSVSSTVGRIRAGFAILLKALPRFAVALASSFFFAEILLFSLVFHTEVEQRVQIIHQQHVKEELARQQTSYQNARKRLTQEISDAQGAADPTLVRYRADLSHARKVAGAKRADAVIYGRLAAAECDGDHLTLQPSDSSTPISTTGKAGTGGACKEFTAKASTTDRDATVAESAVTTAEKRVRDQQDSDMKAGSPLVKSLNQSLRRLDESNQKFILAHDPDAPAVVPGVAVRHQAMNDIERDTDSSTPDIEQPRACASGVFYFPCNLWRVFFQPTPAGPFVGSVRLILLSIELLPILLKVSFSLRTSRPYDELEAALGQIESARSLEMVDNQLNQVGAKREGRKAWRLSMRVGDEAAYYLNVMDEAPAGPARDVNALERELSDRFTRRRRFWSKRRDRRERRPEAPPVVGGQPVTDGEEAQDTPEPPAERGGLIPPRAGS